MLQEKKKELERKEYVPEIVDTSVNFRIAGALTYDELENKYDKCKKIIAMRNREINKNKSNLDELNEKYRYLFIGDLILIITLIICSFVTHIKALQEMGSWFVDRFNNIVGFGKFVGESFMVVVNTFTGWFSSWNVVWCYVLAVFVYLVVTVALIALNIALYEHLSIKAVNIHRRYTNGRFKLVLSVSSVLSLFVACIYMYDAIKWLLPLNIFSVWLVCSIAVVIAINKNEIVLGLND